MSTILPYGAKVVLTSVDEHGLCGRELHPKTTDVGFLGLVVANHVELCQNGCLVEAKENMPGGFEFDEDEGDLVIYTVQGTDGRKLELASYEIEEV